MSFDNVNVNVSGPVQPTSTYKTKVLKGNHSFASQVTEPNMKYVIKHDFDLDGGTVTILEDCLLEFDGGSISNGTLVGQSTILIYNQPLDDILTATLEGTWRHESGVKADEEDITDLNGELKFKDKAYAPANYSGLGRKILRKNIVDGVNTLTQSMMQETNTIYVIQYDFTLASDVTIPVNCVLKFEGGSISGEHTLTGNNTGIQSGLVKILGADVSISGTWNVEEAYPEWLGAKGNFANDDVEFIQNCLDTFKTCYLTGIYLITDTVTLRTGYELIGKNNNVFLISRENIHIVKIASGSRYVKIKNVTIRHDGTHDNTDIIGIRTLDNVNNSIFENIKIINCYYGLYLNSVFWQNNITNIRIDKCYTGIQTAPSAASICNIFNNIYIGEYDNIGVQLNGVKGFSFYNLNIDATGNNYAINLTNSSVYIRRFNVESFRGDIAIYCNSNTRLYLECGGFSDIVMSGETRSLIFCRNSSTLYLNNVNYTKTETDNVYYGVINIESSVTFECNSNLTIRGNAHDVIYTSQGTFNNRPSLTNDTSKIGTPYFANDINRLVVWNGSYWVDCNGFSVTNTKGTTAERPTGVVAGGTLRTTDKGFCYFDTDLSKPIYVKAVLGNGVVTWVDATGATV